MENRTVINFEKATRELLESKFDEEVEARVMKFKPDLDNDNDVRFVPNDDRFVANDNRFVPNDKMLEIVKSCGVDDIRKNLVLYKLYPHFKKLFEDTH